MNIDGKSRQKSFARMRIPKGSELLAEQVRTAIMMGELEEGGMLPSEKELMSQMGLSRSTVREGLRLLEAEGLITTRPGRGGGATVRRPSALGHTRSLATLLQFDGARLDELFEAWSALVPVCGRVAARNIKPEQVASLQEEVARMYTLLDDSRAFITAEVRFHMLIAHATNNAVLRIYGTSLAELTFRQIQHVPFTREEMEAGAAACTAIVASIESGDGRRTEHRIARHLEAVETGIALRSWPLSERPAEPVGTLNRLTDTSDLL